MPAMTNWLITNIVASILLPPFSLVLLILAGLIIHRRKPRLAMLLIFVSVAVLYVLSTPWVGGLLQKSLEISGAVDLRAPSEADAIVVLGGGRRDAPEYCGDTLNSFSLERLRYAARIHQATRLPILVTGGMPGGGSVAEGSLMRDALKNEFHTPVQWVEDVSLTTWDNARLSAPILKQAGVKRILLVTHAWHLRRAVPLFVSQGLEVIPAGINFAGTDIDSPLSLLPSAPGLRDSYYALHEWLGILWYRLRNQLE